MMVRMSEEPEDYEGPWSLPESDWKLVPVQPDDNMVGKLARDIVMWWCMSPPTGRMLHRHVRALHHDVPQWLADLIPDREVVPPKGAVACAIYRAMLDAAPAAPVQPVQAQGEPVEIVPRVWREALRKLTFMARTSGGSAVPDKELQAACAQAEALLSKPYNYPPAAPQQADPVAQIGWADEFGNLFPMGAWKPTQRTHHDSHKTAWRPVFLHPPADEVQRLRDALEQIEHEANQPYIQRIARRALAVKLDAIRAAPQQAEPVAWMFDRRYGSGLSFVRPADYENEDGDMVSPTPLYRHPPADEVQGLRDAAQDVCEWARASQWAAGEDALVPASRLDALLAALEGK